MSDKIEVNFFKLLQTLHKNKQFPNLKMHLNWNGINGGQRLSIDFSLPVAVILKNYKKGLVDKIQSISYRLSYHKDMYWMDRFEIYTNSLKEFSTAKDLTDKESEMIKKSRKIALSSLKRHLKKSVAFQNLSGIDMVNLDVLLNSLKASRKDVRTPETYSALTNFWDKNDFLSVETCEA